MVGLTLIWEYSKMVQNRAKDVTKIQVREDLEVDELSLKQARRTAFVARFIVLREGKRTRAHRRIEQLKWEEITSAEELASHFRSIFEDNGDNLELVDRDIRRALAHASRSISFFVSEYLSRSTLNFVDALLDYERSNSLLFEEEDQPKPGGWRLPQELMKEQADENSSSGKPKRTKANKKRGQQNASPS